MTSTYFIKLYGERNTGTNYVSKLLEINLEAALLPGVAPSAVRRIQRTLPGRDWVRDIYFRCTRQRNLGWKHGLVDAAEAELRRVRTTRRDHSLILLTLTRNPYAWLLSLHRRPYHSRQRGKLDFESFLVTPWPTLGRDNMQGTALASPVELWNAKNRAYLELFSRCEGGVRNLAIERILEDPRKVIESIAADYGIPRSTSFFTNYERSTKERNRNFASYRDYYLNERWKESLSASAIATITSAIDKNLMDRFGYRVL